MHTSLELPTYFARSQAKMPEAVPPWLCLWDVEGSNGCDRPYSFKLKKAYKWLYVPLLVPLALSAFRP